LPLPSRIHISRWMGISNGHNTHMHVFCDASERAYGGVFYARSTAREVIIVRLACSKNRLATVKKITSPSGASSCACGSEATAVLLPRDTAGHQECHIMDGCYGSFVLDTQ
jgi:hypothetical protein